MRTRLLAFFAKLGPERPSNGDVRRLTTLTAAGITTAGIALIAIIIYAGSAANHSATERERILLQNALNRGIARALNEQKSVAWWDDSVTKITDANVDLEFTDANFGIFLTETYGHDEVYILNAENKPLYAFTGGARGEPAAFESRRAIFEKVIGEARGSGPSSLKQRPDAFGADQSNYRVLGGAVEMARWAGHILSVDNRLAIVAALTIVPNVEMSLLTNKPNLLISVTYIDDHYVAAMGRSLLLPDLAILPAPLLRSGVVSEPFAGDEGAHAGNLSWTTQRPGQVLLTFILPMVGFGVLAVAFLAGGMLRRLENSSRELAAREQQSRHDARHDALSGLPNRPHFAEKLQQALDQLASSGETSRAIVAYVYIDRFKDVNDTLGHHAGDELIKAVGLRLKSLMRRGNLLARYGGDEFAILWLVSDDNEGEAVAERIRSAFSTRFKVDGQSLGVTVSTGISIAADNSVNADELMRQADIALYEAKANGRNRSVFFQTDMAKRVEERMSIETDMRTALDEDQFRLNYQPIVSCCTGAIVGVEALLRWRHPIKGEIPPITFIPIAEQSGLMPALGEWVLRRAMKDSNHWPELQVSVNLSPVQFRQVDLNDLLYRLVQEYGVDPRKFVLEITEGVLMESSERTSRTLDAIHAMGFKTALDDFGTGYSSLAYLCNFRFDKIKIDRAFVAGMSRSESYKKIVNAVISLGKGLGMEIVAEGVETESEVAAMTLLGCNELQGYYFSKPIETFDMCRLLETFVPKINTALLALSQDQLPLAEAC